MAGTVTLCIFCMQPTMAVKVDRKGRPYLSCLACNTRVFLRGQHHMHGYAMAVKTLLADPDAKQEWIDAAVAIEKGGMVGSGVEPLTSAPEPAKEKASA